MDTLNRDEIISLLDALEARLPGLIEQYAQSNDSPVLDFVAGEAEMIELRVSVEDRPYVRYRVQCMLRNAELIPGDDEPCDAGEPPGDEGTGGPV